MRLSLQQKEQFFHELGELMRSGRSFDQALETVARSRSPAMREVAEALRVGADGTAAGAFARRPEFSAIDQALVAGGEASGQLERAMGFLTEYHGALARARGEIIAGSLYPAVILHLGAVLLALPTVIASGFGAALGQVAQVLGVAYGFFAFAWVVWHGVALAADRIPALDRALQSLPGLGPVRTGLLGNRFCLVLSLLVKSGGGILGGMERAAAASGSSSFREGTAKAVRAVQAGETLGGAVALTGAFPEPIERAFEVGATTGRLDEEMARQAARYAELFSRRLRLLVGAATKGALMLIILLLAARILAAALASYAEVNSLLNPD